MQNNNISTTLTDCIVNIVGWFQISGTLNPATNQYVPEPGPNGQPISGPGWVSYEKPGAQPGDIVIIYNLQTISLNAGIVNSVNLSSILWDLINPGGISYWTNRSGLKSLVSSSDLIHSFPHPGFPLLPPSNNPNNLPDILWTNVTSQYMLPGPGNTAIPYFIRQVLPSFGLRILVWTDSCCLAAAMTEYPDLPPIIPPIDPPDDTLGSGSRGRYEPGAPPDVPGTPGTGGPDPLFVPTVGDVAVSTTTGDINSVSISGEVNRNENSQQIVESYTPVNVNQNIQRRIPIGSSPPRRSSDNQKSFTSPILGLSIPWVDRVSSHDFAINNRARPVGSTYLAIKQGGVDARLVRRSVSWNIAATEETLSILGLNANSSKIGVPVYKSNNDLNVAPEGRAGSIINVSKEQVETTNLPNKVSSDPEYVNNEYLNRLRTIGGNSFVINTGTSDLIISRRFTEVDYGQRIALGFRPIIDSSKQTKSTTKGVSSNEPGSLPGLIQTRRRTLNIARYVQGTKIGADQFTVFKNSGVSIRSLRKVNSPPLLTKKSDPTGQFEVRPIIFRTGANWAYLTLVVGNVQSEKEVILQQSAYIYSNKGCLCANIGSSGVLGFGRVNPPLPGMYVVANPSCIPGAGNLPDIIAGGQTWNFMTLVSTLINLEGQVIAQELTNFLPALPTDVEVNYPNRLPIGVMRDLEVSSSNNYLYDGTFSYRGHSQSEWWKHEPSLIVERTNSSGNENVTVILKATVTSQSQPAPFRPILEIYDNAVLLSTSALAAFVGGTCNARPSWIDPITNQELTIGGFDTRCPSGGGGSSAYTVDSFGQILTGPYNPPVYAGSHHCYLYFKYTNSTDYTAIAGGGSKYRIRVHNNGPANDLNGYVLYTDGLKISTASASLSIVNNQLSGSITTYHCNHILKIVNQRTMQEVERRSSNTDGTITFGQTTNEIDRLDVQQGDVIKVYRPGFDNRYNSGSVIYEVTIS